MSMDLEQTLATAHEMRGWRTALVVRHNGAVHDELLREIATARR